MPKDAEIPWQRLEALTHRDPAGRGLAGFLRAGLPLDHGQLAAAASDLAQRATGVAIVTGFCIADADPPAAETDGPPGALYLARVLQRLGIKAAVCSDGFGAPLLRVGAAVCGLPLDCIYEFPAELGQGDASPVEVAAWNDHFLDTACSGQVSHLVAIERPGPSHAVESLQSQRRVGSAPLESFILEVPPAHRGVCHNMRGADIRSSHAPLYTLFERPRDARSRPTTIGILDGGNEIGAGSFPWEVLRQAIATGPASWIACRVPTDFTLLAGVSNWGAYGLALGVAALRDELSALYDADAAAERRMIETLVQQAGAVDGVTKRREASVDGLPLDEYLALLSDLRAAVGLPR